MIIWGINALNHGSSLAVFNNSNLCVFEQCAEDTLDSDIIHRAFHHGGPSMVCWYERPWTKKARQLAAGQWHRVLDFDDLPSAYLKKINVSYAKIKYTSHHASHAAAGYYTSPFDDCAVVVLDAIGEFETASIWHGQNGRLTKVWNRSYPHSLGLFYSAFTDLLGMTAIKEEYLLQQMSASGNADRYYTDVLQYMSGLVHAPKNLHKGITDWPHAITDYSDRCDIAAAVQKVFTEQIYLVMAKAKELTNSNSLVYMGGCAMNSAANKSVVEPMFRYRWSLPNPGDPSSSIGAVLFHTQHRVWQKWDDVNHIAINV